MKSCGRTWQAEALEDGRLDDQDRSSFERHAAACAECAAEVAALRSLREKMLAHDAPTSNELARRRIRGEILRRASAPATWRPPAHPWGVAAAVACAAVGLALAWPGKAPPSRFEVIDVASAAWHAETEGATSRVTLDAGTALFQVQKLRPEARFLVRLPDGEIEVRGTRFVVDVEGGHTRSVVVTEGVVALRLGGREQLLRAGDRWPAAAVSSASVLATAVLPASAAAAAPLAPGSPASSGAVSLPSASPAARSSTSVAASSIPREPPPSVSPSALPAVRRAPPTASVAPVGATPEPGASAEPGAAPTASERFSEAMSAFSAGNYGRADDLFAQFISSFPGDGRAEDASFLRIQCHARRGDRAGAALLARQYLRAFPRALRRPEVERFLGE